MIQITQGCIDRHSLGFGYDSVRRNYLVMRGDNGRLLVHGQWVALIFIPGDIG
jgi:hypothetical protein